MRDDLLLYYERELTYLRQIGAQFAEKYPKIARRLLLEPSQCEDPHVGRMLEAFAFLAARVHLKIDVVPFGVVFVENTDCVNCGDRFQNIVLHVGKLVCADVVATIADY